jgi:hypothetical protein
MLWIRSNPRWRQLILSNLGHRILSRSYPRYDEILDYYGWVFCQGGFLNLQMTFEQFLAVVAAVSPSGLCPEYDTGDAPTTTD